MPLPNPRVITAIFQYYLDDRSSNWNSVSGKFESFWKDNAKIKSGICVDLNKKLYNWNSTPPTLANEFNSNENSESWIQLLLDLGKRAREPSELSNALHAVRTYILSKLNEEPILSEEQKSKEQCKLKTALSNFKLELTSEIGSLQGEIEDLKEKKINLMKGAKDHKELTQSLEEQKKKRNETILKLADLGDLDFICVAAMKKFFPHPYPDITELRNESFVNQLNPNIPFCYQQNYYLIHHQIKKENKINFDALEKIADTLPADLTIPESSGWIPTLMGSQPNNKSIVVPASPLYKHNP